MGPARHHLRPVCLVGTLLAMCFAVKKYAFSDQLEQDMEEMREFVVLLESSSDPIDLTPAQTYSLCRLLFDDEGGWRVYVDQREELTRIMKVRLCRLATEYYS